MGKKNMCPPALTVMPSIFQLDATTDSKGERGKDYKVSVEERIEALRQAHSMKTMPYFMKEALVFQHDHLDIDEMEKAPNYQLWLTEAQDRMEDWERGKLAFNEAQVGKRFNPWSTIHIDSKGSIIAAIFAYRAADRDLQELKRDFTDWEEFDCYVKAENLKIRNDGIPLDQLRRFQQATHSTLAFERVEFRDSDTRHTKGMAHRWPSEHYDLANEVFKYRSQVVPHKLNCEDSERISALHTLRRRIRDENKRLKLKTTGVAKEYHQPAGVIHYFESWYQQGHNKENDKPSKSGPLHGTTVTSGTIAEQYHRYSLEIQGILSGMARCAFPDIAARYRSTYQKVSPAPKISPHALFTGHVVVHNMVVHQHRDKSDGNMCAIFHHDDCDGGALVLPQLYAAHGYASGHVAVFHSQALYHGVSTWGPRGDVNKDGIPPGRTAHVFTTHKATIENSEKLPDRYAAQTANGMLPRGRFVEKEGELNWTNDGPATVPELFSRAIKSSSTPFARLKGSQKSKEANEYPERQEEHRTYDDSHITYEFEFDGDDMDTTE